MKVLVFSTADFSIGSGSEIRGTLFARGCGAKALKFVLFASMSLIILKNLKLKFYSTKQGFQPALDKAIQNFKPDIIYGITEGLANVVATTAQKYGCALAFDLHGIGVVEILELGSGYGSRPRRLLNSTKWLLSMRKADVITVANPTLVSVAEKCIATLSL